MADHSYRGVLPTVVRRCVWSRNLMNEEALTHWVVGGVFAQKTKSVTLTLYLLVITCRKTAQCFYFIFYKNTIVYYGLWTLLFYIASNNCCHVVMAYCLVDAVQRAVINTGLFISPSGISELDCATTKTDTAERSISIGWESLQDFFCTRGLGVLPGSTARG